MNNKHFYWIVPVVIILIIGSLVYGYLDGYMDTDLNYQNQMYFCESKGLIFCGDNVGGTEFQCGTGSCWKDSERFFYANPSLELIKVVNQNIKEVEDLKTCNWELDFCKDAKDSYKESLEEERNKIYDGYEIKKETIEPYDSEIFDVYGYRLYLEDSELCNILGIKIDENSLSKTWKMEVAGYFNSDFHIQNDDEEPLEVEFICAKEKVEETCPYDCQEDKKCVKIISSEGEIRWQCVRENFNELIKEPNFYSITLDPETKIQTEIATYDCSCLDKSDSIKDSCYRGMCF